jgi:hypothetical protein
VVSLRSCRNEPADIKLQHPQREMANVDEFHDLSVRSARRKLGTHILHASDVHSPRYHLYRSATSPHVRKLDRLVFLRYLWFGDKRYDRQTDQALDRKYRLELPVCLCHWI